ncbi:MAG: metalloregulator ArsR/SmtB family transcription factor [Candidatus Lokiarchaeia archaeon]
MSDFKRYTVEFLKVIADSTRLEILNLLKGSEKSSSDIQKELDRSQSTISKHLNMLVDNNLIAFEKKDNKKYYKIYNTDIIDLIDRINSIVLNINKEKLRDIQDVDIRETLS